MSTQKARRDGQHPSETPSTRTSKWKPGKDLMTLQQCAEESGAPYTSWYDLVKGGHLERVPFGDSSRIIVRRTSYQRIVNGR